MISQSYHTAAEDVRIDTNRMVCTTNTIVIFILLYCCADAKTGEWVYQPAWDLTSETLPIYFSYVYTRYYKLPGELISVRPSSRVQQT